MSTPISNTRKTPKKRSKPFPIVAIGASAGGLEAVTELLKNLSPATGMAFIYIQHLDPSHKSMLSEILARATKMKVQEARHLLPMQQNEVYVIPPNKDLSIIDGVLRLNPRSPKPSVHMPIDKFFLSLAEKQKESSIGIVLSGNAHDGSFGLKSIKLAGGITFAQDESAKFQSMPRSAIAEGVVDMVLSPKEIAKELERISQHPAVLPEEQKEKEEEISNSDKDLVNIVQLLKKATGVDFSHYKMNTIKRRVIRRTLLYKLDTLEEYYNYLKQHTAEINVLYQDMLINVTSFFRDPDVMEYLKKTVLPKLLSAKKAAEPVRAWVPACSTGEEAYSLAITILEALGEKALTTQVQIFATDLSEVAVARARLGLYSANDLETISQERIDRFFEKIDGSYRVVKAVRDVCIFATHNVFRDPPFSRIDLISCCNLMIYLDTFLQKKLLSIFHYCLKDAGFLILGKSETTSAAPDLFSQIEKRYKLFGKAKDKATNVVFDMNYRIPGGESALLKTVNPKTFQKVAEHSSSLENTVDDILLRQFVPASVVINGHYEILQFRGSTNLFLEPPHGKASLNLLKMARAGLTYELRNAIHKVGKTGERMKKTGLEIKVNHTLHQVSIEVVPLPSEEDERLYLVVFAEMPSTANSSSPTSVTRDKTIVKLQEELAAAKEDMRSMIEEQEASVEELQSANEEIVSSNEELQSINEELETSKEELESSNEELTTINHELQVKNDQLAESYEYTEVVFQAIQEAVLIIDKDFRVKKANQIFYNLFKVSNEETERTLLFELGNKQWNILKLRKLLEEVVEKNVEFSGFEIKHNFPLIGEKIMVLKARRVSQQKHNRLLIVLSIMDITEHRKGEQIIAEQEAWFRNTANTVPALIWVSGVDKMFTFFNETWLKYTGRTMEQEKGYGWLEGMHKDDRALYLNAYEVHFKKRKPFQVEYRLRRADGEYQWLFDAGTPTYFPDGVFSGYVGSCTEIHDRKMQLEEMERMVAHRTAELKEAIRDLEHTNAELNQYAYVASHDLQEPLRKIITFSDRLAERSNHLSVEDKDYLDKIMASASRMRKLINDLLNFSRMSRLNKEFVSTDLNLLFHDATTDLALLIEEKGAKITTGKLPVIKGIPLQLQQLLYNLLNNALKFSRDGVPPKISITAKQVRAYDVKKYPSLDQQRTYCEIIFKDNGIGFKQEFADQIFTIFQRLNDTVKYSGAGIGLALCKKVVINHKGLIYAKAEVDKGSEFHIMLPYEP